MNQKELEELFRDEFRFTNGALDFQPSLNIIENTELSRTAKFRNRREELKAKTAEPALTCNLEEIFKETFETPKENSESLNIIEGTEFTCRIQHRNFENQSLDNDKTQLSEILSPNIIEGTEFTRKIREKDLKPDEEPPKAFDPDECMILGRDSPTLFSPAASDDETVIEQTPPKKIPPKSSFILPPPPEEFSGGFTDALLVPPKEFQCETEPEIEPQPITSTQFNGINFKAQVKAKSHDVSLEYSFQKLDTPTSQLQNTKKCASPQINPILSVMNDSNCPLTIVKPKKPLPPPPAQAATVQKSILTYMRSQEDPNESVSAYARAESVTAAKKPCIACTRLSKDKIIAVNGLCSKKLATYSKDFTSSVTHLVVLTAGESRVQDHTIKYVSAVAAGVWVVSFAWVQRCVAEGRIVDEAPYETVDVGGAPGPRTSRLTRLSAPLLKGFRMHCAPPFETTTLKGLEDVVRNLGGTVVHRPEDLKRDGALSVCLIVTEAKITQDYEQYEEWLERLGIVSVDIEWLSRSVGQYKVVSVRPFILCSEDNLEGLGYPAQLLAHVPDSEYTFSN